jgi:hypothetical protein
MTRFLRSLLWPAGALVFAVGGSYLTASAPAAKAADGQALLSTPLHTRVVVSGQVLQKGAGKDGQPVLTLETRQGLIMQVYVSADAGPVSVQTGASYEFTGTLQGPRFLILDQRNSLQPIPVVHRAAVQAEVVDGWAMVPAYGLRVQAPRVPNGYHQGYLVESGVKTRFEL